MSVSKRLRFEILRRDNHQCQYCGEAAPKVKLTVDHVLAVALGGTDDASNLITACAECNAGKSSATVDSSFVEQVARDSAAWDQAKEAVKEGRAAATMFRGFDDELRVFRNHWQNYCEARCVQYPLPDDWRRSVRVWLLRDLSIDVITECMHVAMNANIEDADTWRYLCGCAWRSITDLETAIADEYARIQAQAETNRRLAEQSRLNETLADVLKRVDE